jgi:hypothetical protein
LVKNNTSIGAIFFMHNEETAAIRAIGSYVNFYGKSNFVLMGNVQESLLKVSEYFGLDSYKSEPYIGPLHELEKLPRLEWGKGKSLELVGIQLDNIYNGITRINTNFALYLHPDHLLKRKIKPANYADLESNTPNMYSKDFIDTLAKLYPDTANLKGYGHPGMINRIAFIQCYEYFKNNQDKFLEIEILSENLTAYDDFLLPILFRICGFRVYDSNITREVKRRRTLWNLKSPLLHQVNNNISLTQSFLN